mmetsp:Transcript_7169/g.32773  ORF Transcript_7169/g.32773 Transcript_7169/m.32773 type:complete len:234 (-) Transcript_7169:2577-3278(-)
MTRTSTTMTRARGTRRRAASMRTTRTRSRAGLSDTPTSRPGTAPVGRRERWNSTSARTTTSSLTATIRTTRATNWTAGYRPRCDASTPPRFTSRLGTEGEGWWPFAARRLWRRADRTAATAATAAAAAGAEEAGAVPPRGAAEAAGAPRSEAAGPPTSPAAPSWTSPRCSRSSASTRGRYAAERSPCSTPWAARTTTPATTISRARSSSRFSWARCTCCGAGCTSGTSSAGSR